jgi:hypothetical protein
VLQPLVLGPEAVPVVTDADEARTVPKAVVLSAMAHGLVVPPDVRERILASTDLAELDRCIRRVAVVPEAREIFASVAS